jgi:DNA invertase Pin-like site-specific DNA recombinase
MTAPAVKLRWRSSCGPAIGYARVSTDAQDLTAQRDAPAALGVPAERLCVDHGLTATDRDRPGAA